MKKLIAAVLVMCLMFSCLPIIAIARDVTPEVSLESFTESVAEIEERYDNSDELFSSMMFKNGSEFYYIDGEEYLLSDKDGEAYCPVISESDLTVPYETVKLYGDKYIDKEYVNLTDLEELGFEVEINGDTAVLSKPLQTNRIIVKSKFDINELDSVDIAEGYDDLHIVQFDDAESAKEALDYYNSQRLIEYAEPDMIMSIQDIDWEAQGSTGISDPSFYDNHLSWGSEYIGVDDYIDYLGDVSQLPQIVVGIIDTGIILTHEFLQGRIIETGVNYSGTGTVDSENDDNGHGTHVAGIIVDNTTENVKISGYKVLDKHGSGSTSNICLAIDKAVEDGVDVINMSLGGKGKQSVFTDTVHDAINAGVVVCVAAGNSGANANEYSPASISGCITVAAIDSESDIPYWSNYGSCVDIIAPGVDIYSSYKQEMYEGWYQSKSGTSMACPFVSAASALILSKHPNYTKDNVLDVLQSSGRSISLPQRFAGLKVLYIGNITEYASERTEMPVFSHAGGYYEDSISVEITCPDENAEIYYTTDGSRASQNNGTLYTEPITVDKVTSLHAAAYSAGKLKSLQASVQYYLRYMDDEGNFEIDENGVITAYNGDSDYLIVPDTISDITVTGIGTRVFYESTLVMIELPDTVTHIDERSFYWCRNLASLKAKNLVNIGQYALARDSKLVDFDVSKLEFVDNFGCYHIGVSDLNNDKLTEIKGGAFSFCRKLINVNLPNVITVYPNAFAECDELEEINLPNIEMLGTSALMGANNLTNLDFPNLTGLGENVFNYTSRLETLNIPKYHGPVTRYLFSYSGIKYLDNDNFTSIEEYAFQHSKIETLILRNATYAEKSLLNCSRLSVLYLPSLVTANDAFPNAFTVSTFFAPKLESTSSIFGSYPEDLDLPEGWIINPSVPNIHKRPTLYFSNRVTELPLTIHPQVEAVMLNEDGTTSGSKKYYFKPYYNIVAPLGSYAQTWAENNGTFISSNSMINALGGSIRLADSGLRFGFSWDNLEEIEQYADNIEYGFVYAYEETDNLTVENGKKKIANNRVDHDGYTTFNLVFTNIPKTNYNTKISARAYVYIDGMYFYSDILVRSFEQVANAVLADETVDEETREQVRNTLEA